MEELERIFNDFESKIFYTSVDEYNQFTIDFVQNTNMDLEDDPSDDTKLCSIIYEIDNILSIIKEGHDKNLFIELKIELEKL